MGREQRSAKTFDSYLGQQLGRGRTVYFHLPTQETWKSFMFSYFRAPTLLLLVKFLLIGSFCFERLQRSRNWVKSCEDRYFSGLEETESE